VNNGNQDELNMVRAYQSYRGCLYFVPFTVPWTLQVWK